MLTPLLTRWFSRQSRLEAPRERPQVVTPTAPAARASRPTAVVPAVRVAVSQTADGMVIRVKGEARADRVGALGDGLLAPAVSTCSKPARTRGGRRTVRGARPSPVRAISGGLAAGRR